MIKGRWQKVVPLAYSLPFFTAKVKQALDHKLYSSALKKKKKILVKTLLHSSDSNPP